MYTLHRPQWRGVRDKMLFKKKQQRQPIQVQVIRASRQSWAKVGHTYTVYDHGSVLATVPDMTKEFGAAFILRHENVVVC